MNRILEFSPSQQEAVVARILVLVHQAMDEHLPSASQATRQFTKTVFSELEDKSSSPRPAESLEAANAELPGHLPRAGGAFADSEDTSPVGRPTEASDGGPPPPPPRPGKAAGAEGAARSPGGAGSEAPSHASAAGAAASADASGAPATAEAGSASQSRATGLDTTMRGIKATQSPDWVTRITLALLLAGLVLLAYALFA